METEKKETAGQAQDKKETANKGKGKGKETAKKETKQAKKCKVTLAKNFTSTFPEFAQVFKKYNVNRIEFSYTDTETKKEITSWFKVSGTKLQGFTDAK